MEKKKTKRSPAQIAATKRMIEARKKKLMAAKKTATKKKPPAKKKTATKKRTPAKKKVTRRTSSNGGAVSAAQLKTMITKAVDSAVSKKLKGCI